ITFVAMAIALGWRSIASAGGPPIPIDVVLISDPREPDLRDGELRSSLERAREIIDKICRRDVRFVLSRHVMLDEYFSSLERRVTPFEVPETLACDPLLVDREELHRRFGDASLESYLQSLQRVRAYRALDGSPLLTEANWHQHNMAYWSTY